MLAQQPDAFSTSHAPIASTSSQPAAASSSCASTASTSQCFHAPFHHQTPTPQPATESLTERQVNYLKSLSFNINLSLPFPRLEGLFPQWPEYDKQPRKRLRAFFVLCPQYAVGLDYKHSSYVSEAEIDESNLRDIKETSQDHIIQCKNQRALKNKEKVRCAYNSWVRPQYHNLSSINAIID